MNTASFTPVRQGLSGRRFSGYRLARRLTRWCQADYSQPARGPRLGKDLLQRLRTGRRPVTIPAEPSAPRSRCPFPRDRELRAIRWIWRHTGCHDQYDDRRSICWSAALRLEVRTQASSNTISSDRTLKSTTLRSRASRTSLVRKSVFNLPASAATDGRDHAPATPDAAGRLSRS